MEENIVESEDNGETKTKATTQDELSGKGNKPTFKQTVKRLAKRWFIDAFSGMALGLFATLIAGTIFAQIGSLINSNGANMVGNLFLSVANIAKLAMGAGIGAGIAYSLKCDKLTIFSASAAGLVGALAKGWLPELTITAVAGVPGNPIGAYVTALLTCEICSLFAGKTKLDIILIPLAALGITSLAIITLCPPITYVLGLIGEFIKISINWNPLIMGVVIAVIMGLLLTLPTSSAAIWVAICLATPMSTELLLAGGAAVVGCSCHMIGFGVMSYKENGFSGLIAQGLGTSMLQIPNLMRNGKILIPPIISSAICGALATTVFKLKCGASGGGMGTSGLVGVFSVIENSTDISTFALVAGIVLLMFVLPAVITWAVAELLRKIGWIKPNDLKLDL